MTQAEYERAIEKAKDLVSDAFSEVTKEVEEVVSERDEMLNDFDEIYNICNGADEDNWRYCLSKIQEIARQH